MGFPLEAAPTLSYGTGGRRFGAARAGGRRHAACDLIAPLNTPILAVENGVVIRGPYPFYHGTDAIEVRHTHFIVRYCEIRGAAEGIGVGSQVTEGQVIAYVGRMYHDSMLHFEMYSGVDGDGNPLTGQLTQRNNPPYQRRIDLIDPTPYLDAWAQLLGQGE
jgi:murein DD-endopeptidase MepM/ murein hydrolase activator NlpD